MNSPAHPNDDARLEAMLRTAAPPLADRGFAARVLAALPPSEAEPTPISWRRIGFGAAGAVAGCGFMLWRGVSWPDLQSQLGQFEAVLANAGPRLADPMLVTALVVTGASLVFAFRAEVRERWLS
jgi:hypothetical protein